MWTATWKRCRRNGFFGNGNRATLLPITDFKTPGSVLAWGCNNYGQTNVPVAAQGGVKASGNDGARALALEVSGNVLVRGNFSDGTTNDLYTANYEAAMLRRGSLIHQQSMPDAGLFEFTDTSRPNAAC